MAGRQIVVEIIGDSQKLTKSFDAASSSAAKFETSVSSVAKAGVAAGAGFLAAQVSLGALEGGVRSVIDTYGKFETQTRQMDAALAAHHENIVDATATLEGNRAEYESWGLTLADVRPIVTKLTEAGIDQSQLFSAMPAIIDLARAKNLDYADAAGIMAKALMGGAKGLADLGIKLPAATLALDENGVMALSATDKAERFKKITDAITDATGDQTTAVDGLASSTAKLSNAWENFSKTTGPVAVNALTGMISTMGDAANSTADMGSQFAQLYVGIAEMIPVIGPQLSAAIKETSDIMNIQTTQAWKDTAALIALTDASEHLPSTLPSRNAGPAPATGIHTTPPPDDDLTQGQHRAGGGSVFPGMPYLVGEHGPERFVPSSSGTILPNGGGTMVFSPTINVTPGMDPEKFARESLLAFRREITRQGMTLAG